MNAALNDAALKLGKRAGDLKHQLARRRGRINRLLIQVQVAAACMQVLDGAKQINEAAADAVDGPSHHHVERAPLLYSISACVAILTPRAQD
jgi:hypothetical protein